MNKLSPKKHGLIKIYIRPEIDRNPWVWRLGGVETTKTVLKRVRKNMAERLKHPQKDFHYQSYADGWIFLCEERRIIWGVKKGRSTGWQLGEEWTVSHNQLHREHPGYDE